MKKVITIICDKDVPVKQLLNESDYDIYCAIGNEDVFTMVSCLKDANETEKIKKHSRT